MKTDQTFWTDVQKLLDELARLRPSLEARPGRATWLKRMLLQLARPFAVPQMDFNKQLTILLERLTAAAESTSQRLDALETAIGRQDAALQKLAEAMQKASVRPAGTMADIDLAAAPAKPRTVQEAIERGFYLQNTCPGRFNVLDEIENWDVLMVLDACRYDAFERVWRQMPHGQLKGQLDKRISVGSHTVTWLKQTFRDRDRDAARIVYLATNPHISKRHMARLGMDAGFAHIEELYQTRWDDRERTVMPAAVAEEYLRLRDAMPGRKFILHFLQPHTPYVGKTRVRTSTSAEMPGAVDADGVPNSGPTELALIEDCQISLAQGLQAYDDNLRLVLDCVMGLLPKISGRVAITADHGELFGEYGIYGHPEELYVPELIEVPWFVCQ